MAGDYIPFDHDFPEKPEVVGLSQDTGVTIGDIMLRCHKLWRQFDRHTPDGFLENLGPKGIAILCGGDESFWLEVAKVGWLVFRDDGCEMVGFNERLDGTRGCAYKRMRSPEQIREKARERKRRQRGRDRARDEERDTPRDIERDRGVTGRVTPPVTAQKKKESKTKKEKEPFTKNQNQNQNQEPEPARAWSSSSRSSKRARAGLGDETTETTDDRGDDDQKITGGRKGGEIDWGTAAERANRVLETLRLRCRKEADRSLVLKVCGLVEAGRLPEAWLADAVIGLKETQTDKGNRWAYFHTCLANHATENGLLFNAMLASVTVPEYLLEVKGNA